MPLHVVNTIAPRRAFDEECFHRSDFRRVRWYGQWFDFTAEQAVVIAMIWRARGEWVSDIELIDALALRQGSDGRRCYVSKPFRIKRQRTRYKSLHLGFVAIVERKRSAFRLRIKSVEPA